MKTEINEIWNQTNIPVIYRRETGPVLIRMPYEKGNRNWLRDNRRNKPVWKNKNIGKFLNHGSMILLQEGYLVLTRYILFNLIELVRYVRLLVGMQKVLNVIVLV